MKRLGKYKELVKAAWQQINNKEISESENAKDVEAFNNFFDKVLICCYTAFAIFSFISLSLFTARVIL